MPLLLAPMAGFTDMSFRTLCKRHGADVTVTEMVSAKGLHYGSDKSRELLETAEEERPVMMQLFGRDPAIMADTAKRLVQAYGGAILAIDVNMGCPAPKITGNGEGSALMKEPELAGRIVEAMAKSVPVPVTVKMRKGYDAHSENAVAFAKRLEACGAAMLTVHGRTREAMYGGEADLAAIAAVKAAVRIPVVGNGDVKDAESARAMRETGCDGIMIGRGALGNPWVFQEVRAALSGRTYTPPDWQERMETAAEHIRATVSHKGERGVLELRKHIVCYLAGVRGAAQLRTRLQAATSAEEMAEILLDTCRQREYNGEAHRA